jgi:hypothetical protein
LEAIKNAVSYQNISFYKTMSCVLFAVFLAPFYGLAQIRGTVQVIKDPLIDTLIARRPSMNRILNNVVVDENPAGYRVQIFFGSNRQAAYDAQARFSSEYQEYRTYITYAEPNFKVHAGDFRTRADAEKLMKDLTGIFTSLFIIPEKINIPKPDQPND